MQFADKNILTGSPTEEIPNGHQNEKIRSRQFPREYLLQIGFTLACVVFILLNTLNVWIMIDRMEMNDFGKFFYSTIAFLEERDMYASSPATLIQVNPIYAQQFWNLNPPHFHLLLIPLALLSPLTALPVWGIVNLVSLIICLHLIGTNLHLAPSNWQSRLAFLGFLAFSGTGVVLITGQLSFLLLLPITLAWIHARKGNWQLTAIFLGLTASIKPFLLIFLPYFLIKRMIKSALLMISLCLLPFGIGILMFGLENYLSWVEHLQKVDWAWASMNASSLGFFTRTFTENPLYAVLLNFENLPIFSWILFSAFSGTTTLFYISRDHSTLSVDRAFFVLLILAILCSPLGWIYYLFLPLGPATSLILSWWRERAVILSPSLSSVTRKRNLFLYLSLPGLFVPIQLVLIFQPNALATLTIGSAFFWSTLAVWLSLLFDSYLANSGQNSLPKEMANIVGNMFCLGNLTDHKIIQPTTTNTVSKERGVPRKCDWQWRPYWGNLRRG